MEHFVQTRDGGVAVVTLNQPDRLNALTPGGFSDLRDTLSRLADEPDTRALVITGAGRAFCAGADLGGLRKMIGTDAGGGIDPDLMRDLFDTAVNPALRALTGMEKPVVCAVNGMASGGGVGLALVGDVVLASPSAEFHLPFAPRLGIVPDAGASWLVTRALGRPRALAAMLTGARIGATQALNWGMVWAIEPEGNLMAAACDLAARLAAQPSAVLPWLRQAVDSAAGQSFAAQLDLERDANAALCATPDFVEGVNAFLEKRTPRFGRHVPDVERTERSQPSSAAL